MKHVIIKMKLTMQQQNYLWTSWWSDSNQLGSAPRSFIQTCACKIVSKNGSKSIHILNFTRESNQLPMGLFGEWSKVSYSSPKLTGRLISSFHTLSYSDRSLNIFRREVWRGETRFYINLLTKQYSNVEQDSRTLQYLTQTTNRILNQPNQIHAQSIQTKIYLFLRNVLFHAYTAFLTLRFLIFPRWRSHLGS